MHAHVLALILHWPRHSKTLLTPEPVLSGLKRIKEAILYIPNRLVRVSTGVGLLRVLQGVEMIMETTKTTR